jgi:hypothetical protein
MTEGRHNQLIDVFAHMCAGIEASGLAERKDVCHALAVCLVQGLSEDSDMPKSYAKAADYLIDMVANLPKPEARDAAA